MEDGRAAGISVLGDRRMKILAELNERAMAIEEI